jgi:hypothetical protein
VAGEYTYVGVLDRVVGDGVVGMRLVADAGGISFRTDWELRLEPPVPADLPGWFAGHPGPYAVTTVVAGDGYRARVVAADGVKCRVT